MPQKQHGEELPKSIKVSKEGAKHILKDENGMTYGSYDNKKEADIAAEGWNDYYRN
jgi:predicted lipoprotein with Yx(FWY)xxD motif